MKLPNGFGGVAKMKGNRRNPYRARKTVGWETTKDGRRKQLYITVGYYPTREEAINALADYKGVAYHKRKDVMTFSELYDIWAKEHFEKNVPSANRIWKSSFKHCRPLWDMKVADIRVVHLENTMKNAKVGDNTKRRIKSLYNLMYRFAMKHEIVDKNYAQLCDTVRQPDPKLERMPFTAEEVKVLKENMDYPFSDMILFGIYSGFRPQELTLLQCEDVNLQEKLVCGGIKTEAGKNRLVPIHEDVFEIVEKRMALANEMGSRFLFFDNDTGASINYYQYRRRFIKSMHHFHWDHTPHDTRHTFITVAKTNEFNEYILKLIVGHAIEDITEKTYTHRTVEELKKEMKKFSI